MPKPHFRLKLLGATVLSAALVTTGLLVSVAPSGAAPDPASASGSIPPEFVAQGDGSYVDPTSILAYRKTNVTPAQVAQRFSSVDSQTVRAKSAVTLDDNTSSSRLVTVTVPDGSAPAVMQSMNASGLYDAVQLNELAAADSTYTNTPNDPAFGNSTSYGLKGGSGGSNFNQVWADLGAAASSASVPVAVLDSGFDLANPDLSGASVKAGWNVATDSPDVSVCGGNAHGTETAGVIGAHTNNGYGIAGAAFDATVTVYGIANRCEPARAFSNMGLMAAGIIRATQDHAKVINVSFSGSASDGAPVLCAAIADATRSGTLVVASAGNNGPGAVQQYPATCPDAVSVTATTSTGTLTWFANTTSSVDIAAAGEGVAVLGLNNTVTSDDGTSFSAPYVAAAASLLMRLVPSASLSQIRAALIDNGNPVNGSPQTKYKILDVKKAYDALVKPTSPISVTPNTVSLASTGDSATVAVNSTGDWTAKSDQSWLTLTTSGTSGNGTLTLNAGMNNTTSIRTALVTVTGPNSSAIVTVTQAATAPNITLSSTTGSVGPAGGTTNITVTSTRNWVATSAQPWVTITPASGTAGSTQVTLTVAPNTTNPYSEAATVTFGIVGGSANYNLTRASSLLVSSITESLAGAANSSTNITVIAGGAWTATSNQSWLKVSPASGGLGSSTLTFTGTANTTNSTRAAVVTIIGPNNNRSSVVVTQAAQPVSVSSSQVSFGSAASSARITVTSPAAWTAASDQPWLTVSPASGASGSRTVTFTATANTAWQYRAAVVTFTTPGSSTTVTVSQAGAPMVISSPTVTLTGTANSSATVTVTATGSWTAKSNQSWLTVSPASGSTGSPTVTFTAAANTTSSARTATVTFSGPINSKATVTVIQTAQPVSVSSGLVSLTSAANSSRVTVTSPGTWTAASDQPWLTVSPATGASGSRTVTFTAAANPTAVARTAVVTFTMPGVFITPGGTATVTVIQAGAPLAVSQPTVSLAGAVGATGWETVSATGTWTAKSNQSWLTLTPPSGGTGDTSVALVANAANLTNSSRSATVTFTGPNSSKVTVMVTQTPAVR